MTQKLLIGFVADLNGNKNAIFSAEPVIRVDGTDYLAHDGRHDAASLVAITAETTTYVHRFRESSHRPHASGDVVWLIGASLRGSIDSVNPLLPVLRRVRDWETYEVQGFAWATGSRTALYDLRMQARNAVQPLLLSAVADDMELRAGDGRTYFELFSELSPVEDLDYFLTRALYYRQLRDLNREELTAVYAAGVLRQVRSARHFRKLLHRKIADLNAERVVSASTRTVPIASGGMSEYWRQAFSSTLFISNFDTRPFRLSSQEHALRMAHLEALTDRRALDVWSPWELEDRDRDRVGNRLHAVEVGQHLRTPTVTSDEERG